MMKKICLIINLIFICTIIVSCNNDIKMDYLKNDNTETKTNKDNIGIEIVSLNGSPTVKFRDFSDFENLKKKLISMSSKEQMIFMENMGIKTFYSEFRSIEDLLEKSISKAGDRETFINNYKSIIDEKSKYAFFKSINLTDSIIDIYPELRAKSVIESNIANNNGYYIIKDSLCKIDLFDSIDDLKEFTTIVETKLPNNLRANNAFARTDDRKARIEIRTDPISNIITFRFSAQRKYGWLITWWSRYSTEIHGFITIDNLNHRIKVLGNSRYEYINLRESGGNIKTPAPFFLEKGTSKRTIELCTNEMSLEFIPFAEILIPSDPTDENFNESFRMSGNMEVWSRGIPYNQAGKDNIDIVIKKEL